MTADERLVKAGALYLVSTPIGNLADITLRAIAVLKQVDLIAAEDTRNSRILLQHYGITTAVTSYHDFNEARSAPALIEKLAQGLAIALITDAGTPGISDPAYYLVRQALDRHIPVQAIPGATALIPALVLSGLPCERFVFEGFLPAKKGRQKRLEQLADEPRTMIFYESPHRLLRTLADLHRACGDRPAAVLRELTKKFEQVVRGHLAELLERAAAIPLKGEFVIVVEGQNRRWTKLASAAGEADIEV